MKGEKGMKGDLGRPGVGDKGTKGLVHHEL